jgi:PBP4 family serine-type D-alanyl-D-alanine carboxypeptidase
MKKSAIFHSFMILSIVAAGASRAYAMRELDYGQPAVESLDDDASNVYPLDGDDKGPSVWQNFGIAYDGDSPYRLNENRLMVPASTMKLLTAITSLRTLSSGPDEKGENFKFKNYFDGALATDGSTLLDPKFTVSGDPTWGHPQYRTHVDEDGFLKTNGLNETLTRRIDVVVSALVAQKIKTVLGPITVSPLRPELTTMGRPVGWKESWNTECYATIPTEVMLNGNCGSLHIISAVRYEWEELGLATPVTLNIKAGPKTHLVFTPVRDSLFHVQSWTVSGTLFGQYRTQLPVHENETWLKNLLIIQLKKAGIKYTETADLKNPAQYSPHRFSVDISSAPLKDILKPCLLESINAVADRLYYENGFQQAMDPSMVAMQTLQQLSGASLQGYVLRDGSGLSPVDQITPVGMLGLLSKIRDVSVFPFFTQFVSMLPVAGKSGTIQTRLKGESTLGKVFAKTGHINRISNLAGYYKTAENTFEPFVVYSEGSVKRITVSDEKLNPKNPVLNPGVDKKVVEFVNANDN